MNETINAPANHTWNARRDERQPIQDKLFVQVVRSDDQDMVGTTISCETLDISPHGMRIGLPIPVPEGNVLLAVNFSAVLNYILAQLLTSRNGRKYTTSR
jgi:hypothetical protein